MSLERLNETTEGHYKEILLRLQALEDSSSLRSHATSTRPDGHSIFSVETSQVRDDTESTVTLKIGAGQEDSNAHEYHADAREYAFIEELRNSPIYKRTAGALQGSGVSAITKTTITGKWSWMSDLSLSDISVISVLNLPIERSELYGMKGVPNIQATSALLPESAHSDRLGPKPLPLVWMDLDPTFGPESPGSEPGEWRTLESFNFLVYGSGPPEKESVCMRCQGTITKPGFVDKKDNRRKICKSCMKSECTCLLCGVDVLGDIPDYATAGSPPYFYGPQSTKRLCKACFEKEFGCVRCGLIIPAQDLPDSPRLRDDCALWSYGFRGGRVCGGCLKVCIFCGIFVADLTRPGISIPICGGCHSYWRCHQCNGLDQDACRGSFSTDITCIDCGANPANLTYLSAPLDETLGTAGASDDCALA